MTQYTYAQLEGLWNQAGGDPSKAAIMAAIAEAESGGNSQAVNHNSNGTTDEGLWQINTVWGSLQTFDPLGNAKAAVTILGKQGLSAWSTYTSGAYKKFLNGATTPDSSGGGAAAPAGAQVGAGSVPDTCLIGFGGFTIPGVSGLLSFLGGGTGTIGQFCLISKVQARDVIGGLLMLAAGAVGVVAVITVIKSESPKAVAQRLQNDVLRKEAKSEQKTLSTPAVTATEAATSKSVPERSAVDVEEELKKLRERGNQLAPRAETGAGGVLRRGESKAGVGVAGRSFSLGELAEDALPEALLAA